MLAEPVVWHFYGDWGGRLGWGRVSLVTTTDDLNTSAHEPVEKGFQNGLGHGTDLVPDDHPRDIFVSHSLGGPLGPAPTKEAVVLYVWAFTSLAHISLVRRCVGVKTRGSLMRNSSIALVFFAALTPSIQI